MTGLRELRPHQVSALDGLKWSLVEGKRRPLLQAVTGFGKTVLAAHIVEGARRKGRRVCFCVPSITLVDQTFERFRENGIDPAEMGIIQASHPWRRPHAPIQIATAQTLARRDRPEVDVVVLDEAHIRFGVYERWMADCGYPVKSGETALPGSAAERGKAPIFIGLTATPWAKGLGLLFDGLIKSSSLAEMIEGGYLSPFRVFAPSHPDLTGVKTVAGDYHEGQLSERMSKATLVANVVSTWMAKASDRPTLCFAVDRAHARALHEEFARAGVPAAYVDAETSREERAEIGAALARGEIKVAVNIGTLTTGVDWDVRCISLCRPTKSESLFVQIIGRGLRTADGKQDCLILDHSSTHQRLGFVTDIDRHELDDGAKAAGEVKKDERTEPLPWECPGCNAVVPARLGVCCECGHVRKKPPNVSYLDGELEELRRDGSRVKGLPVKQQLADMGKASVYAQLQWVRQDRGRAYGWASHAYKEIFGVWPRSLPKEIKEEPSGLLLSWLRSRDIAYAKGMKKRQMEMGNA